MLERRLRQPKLAERLYSLCNSEGCNAMQNIVSDFEILVIRYSICIILFATDDMSDIAEADTITHT